MGAEAVHYTYAPCDLAASLHSARLDCDKAVEIIVASAERNITGSSDGGL